MAATTPSSTSLTPMSPPPPGGLTTSSRNSSSSRIKRRKLASSSSSQSRVPTAAPSSSSAPTRGSVNTTARKALYDRDSDCCFCCGNEDTGQACHVLPEADFKRFQVWHRAGLLGFNSLADPDNLVSLCANCHEHFDCNSKPAGWVFLPTDLDFFLRWETERGTTLSVPTGYTGTYSIYAFISTSRNLTFALAAGRTRKWGGSPTAALLKAGMSIAQVATGPDPLGVPEEVLLQWIKLSAAYQRRCNPPSPPAALVVTAPVESGGTGNDAPSTSESPAEKDDAGSKPDEQNQESRSGSGFRGGGGGGGGANVHVASAAPRGLVFNPASPQLVNRAKPVRDPWVFGPSMSVDQIVNKLRWCHG